MDWTVRTLIWVIEFSNSIESENTIHDVLQQNQYVKAAWNIQRWCTTFSSCMHNVVYLKKGYNPSPRDVSRRLLEHRRRKLLS